MRQLPAGPTSLRSPNGLDASDGIEVAEVVRTLGRQWRAFAAFFTLSILGALAVTLFAPRRFEGKATLLARAESPEGGSVLSRITSIGGLMSGGGMLGGLPSPFESELQVLRSRAVAGRVVDSLALQFSPRGPRGIAPRSLVADSHLEGRFKPRKYRFTKTESGDYEARRNGQVFRLTPGRPDSIDIGTVTLRAGALPESFTLKAYDREDAITRFSKRLKANKAGGEVASIVYLGEDSLTAAAVPNLVVDYYLERRKTVDRGTNQRRLEYVTEQVENTGRQLSATEQDLRRYQEASGVLDAEMYGKAWLDGAVALRESLTVSLVDEGAINQLLTRVADGSLSPRQLAAYPVFIRGSAISSLAGQLTDLEGQRLRLLERRTPRDPEVLVLDQNIKSIEAQIIAMAQSYAGSITERRAGLGRQLDSVQVRLMALPAAAERGGRLQRDVLRLSTVFTALQAQLVEARLAAIGEGGDVRQIDVAVPPRKPAFPDPWITMGIGSVGGLIAGIVAALLVGWFGRWLRDPAEIERATGIAAQRFVAGAPLLLSGTVPRTVLVVPLGDGAQAGAVAQRLAHTATARSLRASILDLSSSTNGNGADAGAHPALLIEKLESEGDMIIVQLPGLSADAAVAAMRENRTVLLVAPPGPVDRARLSGALDVLRRLGVPCAGVVISEPGRSGANA